MCSVHNHFADGILPLPFPRIFSYRVHKRFLILWYPITFKSHVLSDKMYAISSGGVVYAAVQEIQSLRRVIMLQTIIKKGTYQDSVTLMLLSSRLAETKGVKKVSIMMATDANKGVFAQSGLETPELLTASANDMAIVADVEEKSVIDELSKAADDFFKAQAVNESAPAEYSKAKSWEAALSMQNDANLAVISIPGTYAAIEAERALDEGLNVFMFSDNVSIEDELKLKRKAHEKGLVVMGPDCGTGIIQGVPIAFTNNVTPGGIGIIGASGTGIQELTTIIDRLGAGVTNAIGIGGRDLHSKIGGITMLDIIEGMERDASTKVLIVISKPPAEDVRNRIMARLRNCSKPVVTLFLGERPSAHEAGLYHAYTLDEAARTAVQLLNGEAVTQHIPQMPEHAFFNAAEKKTIRAYYSGGTLANEAAMMIKDALDIHLPPEKQECFMLNHNGHVVVDLGDDVYTLGRPHPMIDPGKRIECMAEAANDDRTGVILFDIVMGYGSHEDMAGALAPTIHALQKKAAEDGRKLFFVATVCGTVKDYQGYDKQVSLLKESNVIVCDSNMSAVATAIHIIGHSVDFAEKAILPKVKCACEHGVASIQIQKLLAIKPSIINIGLKSFADVAAEFGCRVVQFDWRPPAGGDLEMIRALSFLRDVQLNINESGFASIDDANKAVIDRITASQPVLVDVKPARELISEFNKGKLLLHAGPPIKWENMTDPMKGSCIGASLFEGWAASTEEAIALLSSGAVRFMPCHHVNAVGPMGGITSPSMPLLIVEDKACGNRAYCTMNEGIGKVLRFGAYSREVVERLTWMRDGLGPVLSLALNQDGELALNPLIAKAISMGDEFHQRNISASLLFLKEMAPRIVKLNIPQSDKERVMNFLAVTDQFFLNIMMACGKAVMDNARRIEYGTVVTAMCRNGENFGIRIAGMGDDWFTAPVNTPQGLYFTGYNAEDASPDLGDSAITETFGVGGMAMIAAPAVTRFVGAGGFEDALRTSNEMMEICISRNPNFTIPTWNFQGACLGIDARKVVEKEITPVINTGIAHRVAGFGQIGAGTVHPPLDCFKKAVRAYAEKLGFKD